MFAQRTIHPLIRTSGASLQANSTSLLFQKHLYQTSSLQVTESDVNAARKWVAELRETSLPSNIGDVSYSRSSGPGGQNVNKFVSNPHAACLF